MKKLLILSIFIMSIILSENVAFSGQLSTVQLNNLNHLERIVLGNNNYYSTPQVRINMIEEQMFGTPQTGSLNERMNFLNSLLQNQNRYYSTYPTYPNYRNYNNRNIFKRAMNNIFGGQVTGYTPQVYLHNSFPPPPSRKRKFPHRNRYGNNTSLSNYY